MRFKCLIAIAFLAVFASLAAGEYVSAELMVIKWGEEASQLKIKEPFYYDTSGTPEDVSDDILEELGGGPLRGFVDLEENVYFDSYSFSQFKVFDSSANLIIDLSYGTPDFNSDLFLSAVGGFYVDSQKQIYFSSWPVLDYIPVGDLTGKLVNKLYPDGTDNPVPIGNIFYNSNDVITFSCLEHGYRTYRDGSFSVGGSLAWKAVDGNYHYLIYENSSTLKFKKFGNPDIKGIAEWREFKSVNVGMDIDNEKFLGVDDSMMLYVMFSDVNENYRIQIYDDKYNLGDEILLPIYTNRFLWYMQPFLRQDGNVYEFRCLDDGLHVIRWSKQ